MPQFQSTGLTQLKLALPPCMPPRLLLCSIHEQAEQRLQHLLGVPPQLGKAPLGSFLQLLLEQQCWILGIHLHTIV